MSQLTFSEAEYAIMKRKTRRELFLEKLDKLLPWKQLEAPIARYYSRGGIDRPPYPRRNALRRDYARRQALVEIDVLVAQVLGLTGVGFPRKASKKEQNEGTCYTIHSPGRREENIPLGWEDIQHLRQGTVTKTFIDDTLLGGPTERTIEYKAPFFKPDREEDYRVAWEVFESQEL